MSESDDFWYVSLKRVRKGNPKGNNGSGTVQVLLNTPGGGRLKQDFF